MPNAAATSEPVLSLSEALLRFDLFKGLPDGELDWFASTAEDEIFDTGTVLVREGDEANALKIVVEGQLRFQQSVLGNPIFLASAGKATGLLPFSRLTRFGGTAVAIAPTRLASLHRDFFPELAARTPVLLQRLVWAMADRIRETTRLQEQREKLSALGKLAAGLAHELNNPASAAQRSAQDLRMWNSRLREANHTLVYQGLSPKHFEKLMALENSRMALLRKSTEGDALERSDREESLATWLRIIVPSAAWELAEPFVEAGWDETSLLEVLRCFPPPTHEAVLTRLASFFAIDGLTRRIQSSTEQISDLIRAVKGYSFVDQAEHQEININAGLDDTLTMFAHRIHGNVRVVREYHPKLPAFAANGVELNQIWTQLIENALDAMNDCGKLDVRTACEADMILIEIIDSGSGIATEHQARVFDPFFTTKDVGAGRGLGLDRTRQIVQKYRGDIRFTSQPGQTCFQVRLPVHTSGLF